jgi:glycosyltransferase involved in cell wall biosynthesis
LYKNGTIGVVVPAFNEEAFIAEVVRTMPLFVDRIYVVNDASTDRTTEVLAGISEKRLVVINHEKRSGAGAAMLTGYKRACEERMDVIAIMAGDGQMDPAILDTIISPVAEGRVDYTKGNRLSIRGYSSEMPALRTFGNRLLTYIIKLASGYWHIRDPLNGYTAITRDVLLKLDLDGIERGYAFETDLLIKLGAVNARVMNVDMPARYRREKSKIVYADFMAYTSWVIFRDFIWRLSKKYLGFRAERRNGREGEVC